MMVIALSVVRFFQLIFAVIVLGLSIVAIKWQRFGSAPASSGYAAFSGAFGALVALVGIAAIFVTSLAGVIMAGVDTLTFVIFLAAGIAYAVRIGGVDCNASLLESYSSPYYNDLMNGGYDPSGYRGIDIDVGASNDYSRLRGRCTQSRADTAFMFLACIASLAAAVLVLLAHRRRGTRHSAV